MTQPARRIVVVTALFAFTACQSTAPSEPPEKTIQPASTQPTFKPGNPTCAALGLGTFSMKIDPPASGTFPLHAPLPDTVTTTTDGTFVDWSATISIDAVIVKGGPNANVYEYIPEASSDTHLSAPINPNNGKPFGISHIDFCFDYEVKVAKTAATSFKRTFGWSIAKRAAVAELTLSAGQIFPVGYEVAVMTTGFVDSDFAAAGMISVSNPAPVSATITGVTDDLPGASTVTVDCHVSFPFVLASAQTLVCDYVAALPDASARVNTAKVTTSGDVGGGSADAAVDFSNATITVVAGCVDVTDTLHGALGTVCVPAGGTSASQTFTYDHPIGPATCGDTTVDNTARFASPDGSASGSATASVLVHVPCPVGCTLTPGYWKTHSAHGPAPFDDTWNSLPQSADTTFFLSGASYYGLLWTPPAGNAYYILAHAYIAAVLNGLNGADTSAVSTALASATSLFQAHTPAAIGALKGSSPLRREFVTLAGTLDRYNNGATGPGHCSE